MVDEVDEEELELPWELNWFEHVESWNFVSLSLFTFVIIVFVSKGDERQQKSTNLTHKASRTKPVHESTGKPWGKFGKEIQIEKKT